MDAEVIGSRFNVGEGKGLEIPMDYKFYGSYLYLKKLRRELKAAVKESTVALLWKNGNHIFSVID